MCLRSDRNEPIEIGVITDLHNKNYFEHSTYEKFNSNEAFMIGEYCYTDYYKPTIQNYIIYKERNVETKYYNPNIVYNMSLNCIKTAEKYTWEKKCKEYCNVYKNLFGK